MTAKAEIPPVNGNEMKVLRWTLCSWANRASVLGFAFITDNRDINGILMIRNRHQDLEIGVLRVPSAVIVVRTAATRLALDRLPFFVGLQTFGVSRRRFHQPANMTVLVNVSFRGF